MGMYTEFHFNSEIKPETPLEIKSIIKAMTLGRGRIINTLPKHPLFETDRWKTMLCCDSYYFSADTISTMRYDAISNSYYLCIRCNLKNYSNEIEKFIDWIKPYLYKYEGQFLGFYRYEEEETPVLIYY